MKHLKLYEEFSNSSGSQFFQTYEETKGWLDSMEIENYTINDDLMVDVDGSVYMQEMNLDRIPVQFGKVDGNFYCYNNKLTSLEGAPSHVDGWFDCYNNNLVTLEGVPSYVDGNFYCGNNNLTSLEGAPSYVGGNFNCSDNNLTTLQGAPSHVDGHFYCSNNFLTIESEYEIEENNPGYQVDPSNLETLAANFAEKVKDHPDKTSIVESLKESRPQVFKELEKLGYDESWFAKNQKSDKYKGVIKF